jgi:hypothetical protein
MQSKDPEPSAKAKEGIGNVVSAASIFGLTEPPRRGGGLSGGRPGLRADLVDLAAGETAESWALVEEWVPQGFGGDMVKLPNLPVYTKTPAAADMLKERGRLRPCASRRIIEIPNLDGGFRTIEKACGKCFSCRMGRKNELVGLMCAEADSCQDVLFLTGTYAPREDGAELQICDLNKRHLDKMWKRLRRDLEGGVGNDFSYVRVIERGERRGRVHWHAMLFFRRIRPLMKGHKVPALGKPDRLCRELPHGKRVHITEWPEGHVFGEWGFSEERMRYVASYVVCDPGSVDVHLTRSLRPMLGKEWFEAKAKQYVDLDVFPERLLMRIPGCGPGRMMRVRGARLDLMARIMRPAYAAKTRPINPFVGLAFDRVERQDIERAKRDHWREDADFIEATSAKGVDALAKYDGPRSQAFLVAWRARFRGLMTPMEVAWDRFHEAQGPPRSPRERLFDKAVLRGEVAPDADCELWCERHAIREWALEFGVDYDPDDPANCGILAVAVPAASVGQGAVSPRPEPEPVFDNLTGGAGISPKVAERDLKLSKGSVWWS